MAPGETDTGRRTAADFTINLFARAILGGALLVPYRWRVPLAGWIVARLVAPVAGYSKRIRANLAYVMPDLPEAEIRKLIYDVSDNAGRTLIEIYSGEKFTQQFAQAEMAGPGVAALEQAHSQGRPVMLVTGHFGNYDAPRSALIARGYKVGALYREMNNTYFNDHYVAAIRKIGEPIFPRGRKGLTGVLKFLRAGGMMGIVTDQFVQDGADLTFFGKHAPTALSAAELALKYNALMVPIYGIRQPDGLRFKVHVEAPIAATDAQTMTQALNDSLEAQIRAHMGQWFWIHRRWKPEWTQLRQSRRAAAKIGPDTPS